MAEVERAELKVEVRPSGGVTLVELEGDLDVSTAETLRQELIKLDLDAGIEVRVNLSRLDFLDSSGMGVLVNACRRVRRSGGSFTTVCAAGNARRVLEITGLADYLQLDGLKHRADRGR